MIIEFTSIFMRLTMGVKMRTTKCVTKRSVNKARANCEGTPVQKRTYNHHDADWAHKKEYRLS
jgi:hypothetical protein